MSAHAPGRLSTSLPLGSLPVHAISPVGRRPQSHSLGCSDRDPEPSTPRRGPVAYTHRPLGGLPARPSQSAPSPAPGSDLLRGPQSRVRRTVHTAPGSEASGSRPCIQFGGSFCWFCLLNVFGVNRVLSSPPPPPRTTPRPRVWLPVANASRALWLLAAHAAARASPSKPLKAVKWRRAVSRMEMKGTHVSGHCPAGPLSSTEVSAPTTGPAHMPGAVWVLWAPTCPGLRSRLLLSVRGPSLRFGELLLGEPPQFFMPAEHTACPPQHFSRAESLPSRGRSSAYPKRLHLPKGRVPVHLSSPIPVRSQAHPSCSGSTCE